MMEYEIFTSIKNLIFCFALLTFQHQKTFLILVVLPMSVSKHKSRVTLIVYAVSHSARVKVLSAIFKWKSQP